MIHMVHSRDGEDLARADMAGANIVGADMAGANEKALSRLALQVYVPRKEYLVVESYACMDLWFFQHTLYIHLGVLPAVKVVVNFWCEYIKSAHTFVMRAVVQLGLAVANVILSRMVSDVENTLSLVAQQPKISHVHCPRTFALDHQIHNADSSYIIDVNGSGGLQVAQFVQGKSQCFYLQCIQKQRPEFCLGCRRRHTFQNGAVG